MRLAIHLNLEREAVLPMNHQHLLTGLVYRLLQSSDSLSHENVRQTLKKTNSSPG